VREVREQTDRPGSQVSVDSIGGAHVFPVCRLSLRARPEHTGFYCRRNHQYLEKKEASRAIPGRLLRSVVE
jgi:hypothetical protein